MVTQTLRCIIIVNVFYEVLQQNTEEGNCIVLTEYIYGGPRAFQCFEKLREYRNYRFAIKLTQSIILNTVY